jgi:hypothetical protein
MVNELNLTFKKLILLSALTVLLGVSLVYAMGYMFKPKSSLQTGSTSYNFTPPAIGAMASIAPPFRSKVLVFAYSGDGFVQAPVMIVGPKSPNPPSYNGAPINVTAFNGTTSTDLQNPLMFDGMWPGVYYVSGTYKSAPAQNATVNAAVGSYCDVFLNFGSVPLPSLGHIFVTAWYTGNQSSGYSQTTLVHASVTISGPESHNGTTHGPDTDFWSPLMFTVAPGEYSVFGTYNSWPQQVETVNVTAASGSAAVFIFGDAPFGPPP